MTKLDEELERLLTRYEELVGRHYRGTLELRGQAEKYEADLRLAADLRDKLRTGQLVPAQPSGDVAMVERVARHLCEREILKAYTRPDRADELKEFRKIEVDHLWENYKDLATAAITAYEAVSGVAKMREALSAFHDGALSRSETIARIDAALGEQP